MQNMMCSKTFTQVTVSYFKASHISYFSTFSDNAVLKLMEQKNRAEVTQADGSL